MKHGGLFEAAFGLSLGEIIDDIGGGTATGRPVKAAQVGGPLGAYFPRALFDTPFDYEAFAAKDGLIGHAGITVFYGQAPRRQNRRVSPWSSAPLKAAVSARPAASARSRAPSRRWTRWRRVSSSDKNLALVTDLCNTMKFGSLCALGGFTPYPVMSAINHFPEDFRPC